MPGFELMTHRSSVSSQGSLFIVFFKYPSQSISLDYRNTVNDIYWWKFEFELIYVMHVPCYFEQHFTPFYHPPNT